MNNHILHFLFLIVATDFVACLLTAGLFFLRLKTNFGRGLAFFFLILAVNSLIANVSIIHLGLPVVFPGSLGVVRLASRAVLASSEWGLILYLLGFIRKKEQP